MHIALKKIYYDLQRFLPKGSDEQIINLYNLIKEHYDKINVISEKLQEKNEESTIEKKKSGRPKKEIE